MTSFGKDVLGSYESATKKEWLITNGIGGYASSTIIGCNTRRYHGLLVAALNPPVSRTVLVSKLEETLRRGEDYFFLSTNKYPNTISPMGYEHALNFSADPFPKIVFSVDNISIEKEIFMVHGENTTIVTYNIISPDEEVTFSFSPLIVCRDFHWIMRENMNFFGEIKEHGNEIIIKPFPDMTAVHIRVDGMEYDNFGVWYKDMEYDRELERGLNYQEDLFNVGKYTIKVHGRKTVWAILSTHDTKKYNVQKLRDAELKRLKNLCKQSLCSDALDVELIRAADKFVVRKGTRRRSVIAGYHWFSDWGRDAFISLPGLMLTTKRYDDAKKVLTTFAASMKKGLIPNLFTDFKGEPKHNTVDASLWFIYAGYLYYKATNDREFMQEKLLPWFEKIFYHYMKGTLYGIRVDDDGLVTGGDETTQLTWMDVKIGDHVITKRHGKPVEVNALWYNAVSILNELTRDQKKKKEYEALLKKIRASFQEQFYNADERCLYDVIYPDGTKNASIRPNQILAVSLKFSMLDREKEQEIFDKVEHDLLTPFGLRSLSKDDPEYHGRCVGNQIERDRAYHQGSVWSWFIGPYIDAYIKLNGLTKENKKGINRMLQPLFKQLKEHGLGGVSEIFDGDGPHTPRGTIAQAWSIAELLRVKKMIS